jgi:hypothetical protein
MLVVSILVPSAGLADPHRALRPRRFDSQGWQDVHVHGTAGDIDVTFDLVSQAYRSSL